MQSGIRLARSATRMPSLLALPSLHPPSPSFTLHDTSTFSLQSCLSILQQAWCAAVFFNQGPVLTWAQSTPTFDEEYEALFDIWTDPLHQPIDPSLVSSPSPIMSNAGALSCFPSHSVGLTRDTDSESERVVQSRKRFRGSEEEEDDEEEAEVDERPTKKLSALVLFLIYRRLS